MKKLLIILLLSGCASHSKTMETWIGAHIDEFIVQNGVPIHRHGNSYLFIRSGGTGAAYVGGELETFSLADCRTTVTTDDRNIIRHFSYSGYC